MADCFTNCWKNLVIIFNVLFLLIGLGLLGYGIYLQLTLEGYEAILGYENINPGTFLIIIGGIMIIIAFFGCCGAWFYENSCGACMLRTFGALITLLLLLQVIFVLVVYFKQDAIQQNMKGTLKDYDINNATEKEGVTKLWDTMQRSYGCCGVTRNDEWEEVYKDSSHPKSVPDSCCLDETPGCGKDVFKNNPDDKNIYTQGCYLKLSKDSVLLGVVGGVLLVVQLLAIIVSCCMARRKSEGADGNYELANMDG